MLPPSLRLRALPGLVIQLAGPEAFVVRGSYSHASATRLVAEHIRVLGAFARERSLEEACDALEDVLSADEVEALCADLLELGLLLVEGTAFGVEGGFGRIDAHVPMVADQARVYAYAAAIAREAPGRRVAELGCGSGILTTLAARAGATHVWACDETDIIEVAQRVVADNGVADRVTLVRGPSHDLMPPEPVDVLVHEIFGVDPFDEGVLQALADARDRWLAPGGRLLPDRLRIVGCGVGGVRWRDGAVQRENVEAVIAHLGLRLDPILEGARRLSQHPTGGTLVPELAEVRVPKGLLLDLDLTGPMETEATWQVRLSTDREGQVDALLVWMEIPMGAGEVLSTGPFDRRTSWGWLQYDLPGPVAVGPGRPLQIVLARGTEDGRDRMEVREVRTG